MTIFFRRFSRNSLNIFIYLNSSADKSTIIDENAINPNSIISQLNETPVNSKIDCPSSLKYSNKLS
ncbi:MAG: hypothetical protein ACLRQF_10060 [Thomasclavelia ramosa]